MGDPGARAEFERLLEAEPGDDALRAELAALLIEQTRYDDARKVLDGAPAKPDAREAPLEILADWGKPLRVKTQASGRELVIRSAEPLPPEAGKQFSNYPAGWVAGVAAGYDTILITAAREVEWKTKTDGQRLRIELRAAKSSSDTSAASKVRVEVLRAQIDVGRGRLASASKRYEALSAASTSPAASAGNATVDPAVLLGFAQVEQQIGRWRRAERLLTPLAFSEKPGSEEARRLRDAVWRDRRDQVQIDTERRSTGGLWSLDTARIAGHAVLAPSLRIGYRLEAGRALVNGYRDLDGGNGAFSGARRRGEIYLQADTAGGSTWRASLLGSERQAGAGLAWERHDAWGSTRASAEYGRPFWEFAEGLAQGGTRDRVEVMRRQRMGRATAWVAAAASRYGLRDLPAAVGARGVSGGFSYALGSLRGAHGQGRDQWVAEYGFDAEHRTSVARRPAPSGRLFAPLPFVSREIHTVGAATVQPLSGNWRVEAGAGMMVDRLGGRGPYMSGRAVYDAPGGLSFQMFFDRRINNLYSAAGAANQAGVSVTYRFGAQGR
ncbi:MAG: tetratricopeptide repeat protein [Bryobacteraceae bacterium]